MILEKARLQTAMHADPGSGYNRNTAMPVPGEVMPGHGQQAVDVLIREHGLEQQWDIKPVAQLESAFTS